MSDIPTVANERINNVIVVQQEGDLVFSPLLLLSGHSSLLLQRRCVNEFPQPLTKYHCKSERFGVSDVQVLGQQIGFSMVTLCLPSDGTNIILRLVNRIENTKSTHVRQWEQNVHPFEHKEQEEAMHTLQYFQFSSH